MKETFSEWLERQPSYGLCNPPLEPNKALDFLFDYLLVDDYDPLPEKADQTNTWIVHEILMKYSREYRKEREKMFKKYARKNKKIKNG